MGQASRTSSGASGNPVAAVEAIIQQLQLEQESLRLDAKSKFQRLVLDAQAKTSKLQTKGREKIQQEIVKKREEIQKAKEAEAKAQGGYVPPAPEVAPPGPQRLPGAPTAPDTAAIVEQLTAQPGSAVGGAAVQGGGAPGGPPQIPGLNQIPQQLTSRQDQTGVQLLQDDYGIQPIQTTTSTTTTQPNALRPQDVLQLQQEQYFEQRRLKHDEAVEARRAVNELERNRLLGLKTEAIIAAAEARTGSANASQIASLANARKTLFDMESATIKQKYELVDRESEGLAASLREAQLSGKGLPIGPEGEAILEPGNPVSAVLSELSIKYGGKPLLGEIFAKGIAMARTQANKDAETRAHLNDPSRYAQIQRDIEIIQDPRTPAGHPEHEAAKFDLESMLPSRMSIVTTTNPDGTTTTTLQQGKGVGVQTPANVALQSRQDLARADQNVEHIERILQLARENPNLVGPVGLMSKVATKLKGGGGAVAAFFGDQDAFDSAVEDARQMVESRISEGNAPPEMRQLLDPKRLGELQILENFLALSMADVHYRRHLSAESVRTMQKLIPKLASFDDPKKIITMFETLRDLSVSDRDTISSTMGETGISGKGAPGKRAPGTAAPTTEAPAEPLRLSLEDLIKLIPKSK